MRSNTIKAEVAKVSFSDVDSEVLTFSYNLPPDHNKMQGEDERWGFLDCMFVGLDSPENFKVGGIYPHRKGDIWELVGSYSEFVINKEGILYVKDPSKLEEKPYEVKIRRTNGEGVQETTQIVTVVSDNNTEVVFCSSDGIDTNDGRQPHKPKYSYRGKDVRYKRGSYYNECLFLSSNTTVSSYGDPLDNRPHFHWNPLKGVASTCEPNWNEDKNKYFSTENVTLTDLHFSGSNVPMRIENSIYPTVLRCLLTDNEEDENSSGLRLSDILEGSVVRFLETERLYGDSYYATFLREGSGIHELGYSTLTSPLGKAADAIQVTHENRSEQWCYNVWIHHNFAEQRMSSDNRKGSCVVEGASRYLVEDNIFDGKYFGIGLAGNLGTCRRNTIRKGGLPETDPNESNSWGIGIGADDVVSRLDIYDNTINGVGGIKTGLLISGYGLSGDSSQRYDLLVNGNKVFNTKYGLRCPSPWSGRVDDILTRNLQESVSLQGSVATLGEILEQDIGTVLLSNNKYNEKGHISLSGDFLDGGYVQADTSQIKGFIEKVVWRLNGKILQEGSGTSFLIPEGSSSTFNERLPLTLNTPSLSCYAVVKSTQEDFDIVYSNFVNIET